MEEATGAPSSFTVWYPKRLRASGRDGGSVMTRPPSPLTMLFSRHTRRRQFISLLGGAAAWPATAWAQQATMPVIGWLSSRSAATDGLVIPGFRRALAAQGYIEGQNVAIVSRFADGRYERLPSLAADLMSRQPSVVLPTRSSNEAARVHHAFEPSGTRSKIGFALGPDRYRASWGDQSGRTSAPI